MDKIIFLDCDGVISTLKSGWHLDPEKLDLLGKLLEATDAKIVVSSSWRWHTVALTIEKSFPNFPFKDKIIGVTPRLNFVHSQGNWNFNVPERGLEIDAYLESLNHQVKYVILDDDTDFLWSQKDNFVHTDSYLGMSEENVIEAINILNKE